MTPLSPGKPNGEYGMSCLYRTSGLDEPGNVQRAVVTNMHITLRDTRFTVRPSAMPPGSVMFIEIGKHSRKAVTWESAIGPEMLTRPATDCVPVK